MAKNFLLRYRNGLSPMNDFRLRSSLPFLLNPPSICKCALNRSANLAIDFGNITGNSGLKIL
jgi:hypothetical protein